MTTYRVTYSFVYFSIKKIRKILIVNQNL